jgi:hypothetical protein
MRNAACPLRWQSQYAEVTMPNISTDPRLHAHLPIDPVGDPDDDTDRTPPPQPDDAPPPLPEGDPPERPPPERVAGVLRSLHV